MSTYFRALYHHKKKKKNLKKEQYIYMGHVNDSVLVKYVYKNQNSCLFNRIIIVDDLLCSLYHQKKKTIWKKKRSIHIWNISTTMILSNMSLNTSIVASLIVFIIVNNLFCSLYHHKWKCDWKTDRYVWYLICHL